MVMTLLIIKITHKYFRDNFECAIKLYRIFLLITTYVLSRMFAFDQNHILIIIGYNESNFTDENFIDKTFT